MVTPYRDHHAFCGMIAGFVATLVMSGAMMALVPISLAPDIVGLISGMLGVSRDQGWLLHFLVGTVAWGGLFAVLQGFLPSRSALVRGVMFAMAAWVAMMLILMPLADAGYFGLGLGLITPLTTLFLHVIFGAALGIASAALPMPEYDRGPGGMLRRGL